MAISLEFHSEAREEFDQAFDWYAARSHGAAFGFASAVEDALDRIVADPKRFAATYDNCRYCTLLRFPFSVVYYLHEDHITVVAVAHAKRRPGFWRSRR
jgi:plasmid stabilization system protein ParE